MYVVSKFFPLFSGKKLYYVQEHKEGPHSLNNDI